MGYFNWFYQFRCHRYLNEKPFFPISSIFHAILGFWGHFWGSRENFSKFQKLRLYLLLYSRRPSWSHGFNAKIRLKNNPSWAEIFEKMQFWLVFWFGTPCWNIFVNISAQGGSILNWCLCWNCDIKRVVLSTIKGTNGVKKFMKILSRYIKNHLKTTKLGEN